MIKKKTEKTEKDKEKNDIQTSVNDKNKQEVTEDKEEEGIKTSQEKTDGLVQDKEEVSEKESDTLLSVAKDFEEKLADMQDKYLRLSAEFDNYRKRTLKEKMEISKYAGEEIFKNLLPFSDDFERALKHIGSSSDLKSMKEGLNLIYSKFTDFLNKNGIREIESLDTSFNVDLHDAVAKVPVTDESKKGKIVEVLQKGYYLKDKVLRHSKVVVGE